MASLPNSIQVLDNLRGDAQTVADVVRKATAPRTVDLTEDGLVTQVLLYPEGMGLIPTHKLTEHLRTAPVRRQGTAVMADLGSFVQHVKRFADSDSAVFANLTEEPELIAVLDYHRQGSTGAPRFCEHITRYVFPLSDAWVAWKRQNARSMSQADFAAWVEDRLPDVASPDNPGKTAQAFMALLGCTFATPAMLLEMSRGLTVYVNSKVQNHGDLSNGETSMVFVSTHEDGKGGNLKVARAFLIQIQVFKGGPLYQIPVRLRYRVSEGRVTWSFELYRIDDVFEDAVSEACGEVATSTGLPLFRGQPEGDGDES